MKKQLIIRFGMILGAFMLLGRFFGNVTGPVDTQSIAGLQADAVEHVAEARQEATVEKWRRWVLRLPNPSYSGNPFELEVDATFRHSVTGTTITLPGYYAGSDTWEVGFMPTETGDWSYTTTSQDADLNNVTGSTTVVESGLPGMLKADPQHPRKWKFSDGPYVVPLQFRMEFFFEPGSAEAFEAVADFLKEDVEGHILDTRLMDETRSYNNRADYIFEGDWSNHRFDLENWDRFQARMEVLASRGLGAHIMFYSDDAGKPQWAARSETERLVIRYVVARTAGYPVVWYNSGIDIAEYRDQSWVNWFGEQIQSLDPYEHPVSSRHGGGSGTLVMSGQTWDSRGDRLAIVEDMRDYFLASDVPVSMDDAWHENSPDGERRNKNFSEHDIRRAFWKCLVAGGLGGMVRGYDGYFHIADFQSDLEAEQFLRLINPFIERHLGDTFGVMVPDPSLVEGEGAHALADPGRTKILSFFVGRNDRYDAGSAGPHTLRLSQASGTYGAIWFDPRTGDELSAGTFAGGAEHQVTPPNPDDWVLLLTRNTGSSQPTRTPDPSQPTRTPDPSQPTRTPEAEPTQGPSPVCGAATNREARRTLQASEFCGYLPLIAH